VSGHEQQRALGQQLFSCKYLAFFLNAEQKTDKIIALMFAPFGE
jgi:hypothetical protein